MSKELLSKINDLYINGGTNIIDYLKSIKGNEQNSIEDILISYDFQSGSYTKGYIDNPQARDIYIDEVFQHISTLEFNTLMELGVGEATTLGLLMKKMPTIKEVYGLDLSWSRIKYANLFLQSLGLRTTNNLFTGDLFNIPLANDSIDLVYTNHSFEPNGGREKEALQEAYRVAKKYVVLIEPCYEIASLEGKRRMENLGYIQNLKGHIQDLGYKVILEEPIKSSLNKLNPSKIIIIKKKSNNESTGIFMCPITKTNLTRFKTCYYSEDGMLAYPILEGIPCLIKDNAVVATKMMD